MDAFVQDAGAVTTDGGQMRGASRGPPSPPAPTGPPRGPPAGTRLTGGSLSWMTHMRRRAVCEARNPGRRVRHSRYGRAAADRHATTFGCRMFSPGLTPRARDRTLLPNGRGERNPGDGGGTRGRGRAAEGGRRRRGRHGRGHRPGARQDLGRHCLARSAWTRKKCADPPSPIQLCPKSPRLIDL